MRETTAHLDNENQELMISCDGEEASVTERAFAQLLDEKLIADDGEIIDAKDWRVVKAAIGQL